MSAMVLSTVALTTDCTAPGFRLKVTVTSGNWPSWFTVRGAKPTSTCAIDCSWICPVADACSVVDDGLVASACRAAGLWVVVVDCVLDVEPTCEALLDVLAEDWALLAPGSSAVCTWPPPSPLEFCRLTPAGTKMLVRSLSWRSSCCGDSRMTRYWLRGE